MSEQTAPLDEEGNVLEEKGTEIAEFKKTEAALNELRLKFRVIPDCETKEGYEECRVGIRELVTLRTSLGKARLKLNKDDQDRIKFRNAEEKRIIKELSKLELPMKAAKDKIDDAVELAKEEKRIKEEKRVAAIEVAIDTISEGLNAHPGMGSALIAEFLKTTKTINVDFDFEEFSEAAELERERVVSHLDVILAERMEYEKGQEDLKAQQEEQDRVAEEQAESARKFAEQQAAEKKANDDRQAALDKEREEFEAEKREVAEKKAAEEKAEYDRIEEKENAERERIAREDEALRQEALRPEKERLTDWAKKLRFIDGPDGIKAPLLVDAMRIAIKRLNDIATDTVAMVENI